MSEHNADIEQILAVANRHRKNPWRQASAMREIVWQKGGDAYFAQLLWELIKTERFDVADKPDFWWYLKESPAEAFDGADYLGLYRRILEQTDLQSHHLGSDWTGDRVPGWNEYLQVLLVKKKDDPDFKQAMAEGWRSLPPKGEGFAYILARYGFISPQDLPEGTLEKVASLYVRHNPGTSHWEGHDRVWPPEVWARALIDAALALPPDSYLRPIVVTEMTGRASPVELVALAEHVSEWDLLGLLQSLDLSSQGVRDALLDAARKLAQGGVPAKTAWSWPAAFVITASLTSLKQRGETLDQGLDPCIADYLSQLSPADRVYATSGLLRESLKAAIPADRLESLMIKTTAPVRYSNPQHHFALYPACLSQAVLEHTVRCAAAGQILGEAQLQQAREALTAFGQAAIVPINKALETTPPGRALLVDVLAAANAKEAIPGLTIALGDTAKGVREVASKALAAFDTTLLLPHLEPILIASRKKEARLAAAQIVSTAAITPELRQTAEAALKKERIKEIREQLQSILDRSAQTGGDEARPALDEATREAIVTKLDSSKGQAWKELQQELGDGLLEVASVWISRHLRSHSQWFQVWEQVKSWGELLADLRENPRARTEAFLLVPIFVKWERPEDYLRVLLTTWPESLAELSALLRKHKFKHREGIYHWLSYQPASEARFEGLAQGIDDGSAAIREAALQGFCHDKEQALVKAWSMLASSEPVLRRAAAAVLRHLPDGRSIAPLEEALKTAKSAEHQALSEALVACQALAFDMKTFEPPSPQNDAALDRALSRLHCLPPPQGVDLTSLPTPRLARSGEPLSQAALAWMLGKLGQESRETRDPDLWPLGRRLDRTDSAALCEALLACVHDPKRGWIVYAQALLGSDRHLDQLGRTINELAYTSGYHFGADHREALLRQGANVAVRWLEHWSRRGSSNTMRGRLKDDLRRLADEAGLTVDDLLDRALGDFGFDEHGEQTLEYGGRELRLKLDPKGELIVETLDGKRIKTLPAPRKDDDAGAIKAAKDQVSALRKELKQARAAQVKRLELALASGRVWPVEQWETRYLRHPVMAPFTRSLVFQLWDASKIPGASFIVNDEGCLETADLQAVILPHDGFVGLAHPVEMSADDRDLWTARLDDLGRPSPFAQMNREFFVEGSAEAVIAERVPLESRQFFNVVQAIGYGHGPRGSGGLIFTNQKLLDRFDVTLRHSGYAPEILADIDQVEINQLTVSLGETVVPWSDLSPRLRSELLHDLHHLTESP